MNDCRNEYWGRLQVANDFCRSERNTLDRGMHMSSSVDGPAIEEAGDVASSIGEGGGRYGTLL